MVAIKLETKVGRGKASPITATINSWTGYADTKRCFSKSSLKFFDFSRIYRQLGDLELKVNFTDHLSFPILLTDSRFLLPLLFYH